MALTTYSADSQQLRETFGHFPSGVAALAAELAGERQVLVASSFTVGVSMDPPLVMFAVQKSSSTWPVLSRAERIGISILGGDHANLCRQLASKDKANRFTGVETETTDGGAVLIGGSSVWLECSIYGQHEAGDHDVILFEVHALHTDKATEPLVFHGSRFRRLVADVA
jgi:flavin reductase (DIM6/NTAB) family NADH-FMN oxidoreductase RutF